MIIILKKVLEEDHTPMYVIPKLRVNRQHFIQSIVPFSIKSSNTSLGEILVIVTPRQRRTYEAPVGSRKLTY